jgi:phage major head subunit gpT-like protein
MPANTGSFPKLLETNIRKYFFDRYNLQPKEYTTIFNVINTDLHHLDDHTVAPIGAATAKTEGNSVTYADLTDGYDKKYTPTGYAIGFRSTYEMLKFDQSGIIKKAAGMLSRSINQTMEVYAAAHFNTGFTSATGAIDSQYLFDTDHPFPQGGTYANRPTAGTNLSETSLDIAMQYFDTMVDGNGFPLLVKPKTLVIPPQLRTIAGEILKTEMGLYTDEGTKNMMASSQTGLTPFVWHFLTSAKAWFLLPAMSDHDFNFVVNISPMFDRGDDFDSGDSKWKAFVNFAVGNSNPQAGYGNPGLGG